MTKNIFFALVVLSFWTMLPAQTPADHARWSAEAARVTITRDDWGIAHVHGTTDADAVFGTIYAQCEDDFQRVETNYLVSLGRQAESSGADGGEAKLWQDLRQRLFVDPEQLRRDYAGAPAWMQALMDAWANGINFYLSKHPEVRPQVLTKFEPWMALSFTEGSIGGDIERINLEKLRAFYDRSSPLTSATEPAAPEQIARGDVADQVMRDETTDGDRGGSNGFAIGPSNTADHHALLLINPHTSFFFRSELQMSSDQGLDAYGAVTWGQFFVYQGFNDRAGWMHTSSSVDAVDEFSDTLVGGNDTVSFYRFGGSKRPLTRKQITLRFSTPAGLRQRTFTVYYDHRGPVIREEDGKWVSVELMNLPVEALEQSYLRTKARTYAEYRKTMQIDANSSNDTIFANADGDIAFWHGNFIPVRDVRFDYAGSVDGANPATDWQGLMSVDQIPQLRNPKSGWLENVNNWPWSGAGENSLKRSDYPAYLDQGSETARGLHAVRVLEGRRDFTLDKLLAAAFDPYLPWFARTIPALLAAYDALPGTDPQRVQLREQISLLRGWDFRWGADSNATSLAVYWGEIAGYPVLPEARRTHALWEDYVVAHVPPAKLLAALTEASNKLMADFGTWQVRWGQINRFQRLDDDLLTHFDDRAQSVAVPFTSSAWGSLASFATRANAGTKKRYGISGNSFVAVVEFGPRVRARAVTAGGESGHPDSPHFNDEALSYASGNFREVYFYPDQLRGHTERVYHPGQ